MKTQWFVLYTLVYWNLCIQSYENRLLIKKLTKQKKKVVKQYNRVQKQANFEKKVYKCTSLGFCILDMLNDITSLNHQIALYQTNYKSLKLQKNSVLKLLLNTKIFIPHDKFANWKLLVSQKAA